MNSQHPLWTLTLILAIIIIYCYVDLIFWEILPLQVKHLHFQLYHSVFLPIDQLTHWSISFFPLLLTRIYSVFDPQKVLTHIFSLFLFPHPASFLSHTSLQFVVVVFSPTPFFGYQSSNTCVVLYNTYSRNSHYQHHSALPSQCTPTRTHSFVQLLLRGVFFSPDLSLWYLRLTASPLCWSPRCWCRSDSCEERGWGLQAVIPELQGGGVCECVTLQPLHPTLPANPPLPPSLHSVLNSSGHSYDVRCKSKVIWVPVKPQQDCGLLSVFYIYIYLFIFWFAWRC